MSQKTIYLGDVAIGHGWRIADVTVCLEELWGHHVDPEWARQHTSEGPDGFYVSVSALAVPIHADEARL
ncbi:MAG: hypothetical protein ACREFC_15295 [Stellaceae bacterium]